jgi:hypothetical protein
MHPGPTRCADLVGETLAVQLLGLIAGLLDDVVVVGL